VFLHVQHHIREDAQTLFGFLRREERATFQVLIATHGVGPALAMAILATHSPGALVDIVTSADHASLTLVPGVGKKTAERLIVELKNRLNLPVIDPVSVVSDNGSSSTLGNVREALFGLGYAPDEVRDTLRELPDRNDAAAMLREALQLLGARRA
jgi:holliday junction DNA helicase RuvA